MLLSTLLSLTLLAAPQAPARAERLTFVPRLDALAGALPFFEAAGTRSGLLRPEGWRGEALPLLGVDVTRRDSLEAAGLDPAGPLTISRLDGATFSCLKVADPRRFQARVDDALARRGARFKLVRSGVAIAGARDAADRLVAAVGTVGPAACALSAEGGKAEPLLAALVEALKKPVAGPGLGLAASAPGVVQLLAPSGPAPFAAGLATSGLTATVTFRTQGLEVPALQGPGPSPYGALAAPGLGVVRARFAPAAMPAVLTGMARAVPGGEALAALAPRLGPLLTGQAAALFWQVSVSSGLRTPEARFHAVKLALALQVRDPAPVQALLGQADLAGLAVREGQLTVEVLGDTLLLSNEPGARAGLVAALATAAGTPAHALEVVLEPPRLAGGLAQVPLLEAVRTPELAGLVAASAELGPLLLASSAASLWLDPVGKAGHAGQARWVLDPARFPAGVR